MTARTPVKISKRRAQVVAVITSPTELRRALRVNVPPDFFEIRLDHLIGCLDEVEKKISILPAPIIITARHPAEGGANRLSTRRRNELLMRFLPLARYVDLELRSAEVSRAFLDLARKKKVGRIISFHDLRKTPTVRALKTKARAAKSHGADIFKVATRTDTLAQAERLFDFFASHDVDLAISAMGIGKLGAVSRMVLAQLGSVLNYGALSRPAVTGQLSIEQLRSALTAAKIR